VGIGNLGGALLKHRNFPTRGFHFVAAFDSDPSKIGKKLSSGLKVQDITKLDKKAKKLAIDIGVITTPQSVAQKIANSFIDADINAILNFSPAQIYVPDHCIIENIDFSIKLDILTYKLKHEIGI
jgi:redox-sensing transcriptional repressor